MPLSAPGRGSMSMRMCSAAAATALVGSGLLLTAAVQPARADANDGCALGQAEITSTSEVREDFTTLFNTYSDSGVGWTGGDSTYSAELADGRQVWIFSDTFLGPVNDDLSRPESTPFLNNSFVVQDGLDLSTVHGGTDEEPGSLLPPPAEDSWYWVGDSVVDADGHLQVTAAQFSSGGGGMWDFWWDSNHLATFDAETFQLLEVSDLPSESGVQWSSWIEPAGEVTYVYGIEDAGESKYMHVARVNGPDLRGDWEYWTGHGWDSDETHSARVMDGVANEYSVTAFHDGYLLITQDTHEAFSAEITAYTSCFPNGPFEEVGTIHQMPEVGAAGSYGNANIYAYNAHEHPQFRTGDSALLSYNVNSFDSGDLYQDVSIYRPRFVQVDFTVTPGAPEQPTEEPTAAPTEQPTEADTEQPSGDPDSADDPEPTGATASTEGSATARTDGSSTSPDDDPSTAAAPAGEWPGGGSLANTGTGTRAMLAAVLALAAGAGALGLRRRLAVR